MRRRLHQNFHRPEVFIDHRIPGRDLLQNLLRPIGAWIGFGRAEALEKFRGGPARRAQAEDDFLQIGRLVRGQFGQAKKCRRIFRFFPPDGDLPEHVKRVGQTAQRARVQKRARRQFLATGFKSPEAGEQVSAVHRRDVAGTQRFQLADVVPVKKMAFETLEPAHRFQRAEVACDQVVDRDVTEIVGGDRRQHPEPDVRGRSAQKYFPGGRFLNVVRRQPGGLWSDKLIKVSPGPARGGAQEPPIICR